VPAGVVRATPEQELARLLTCTEAMRASTADRIGELFTRSSKTELVRVLDVQRILPLAQRRLAAIGLELPDPGGELNRFTALVRGRALAQQVVTAELLDALEAAGIRALPLKGPYLGEWLYGDPGLRGSTDIDLLVGPGSLATAVEVAVARGYRPLDPPSGTPGLPLVHQVLEHPELPILELHHRVHWHADRFSAELLRDAAGSPLRPSAVHELTALLLHYARDGLSGLRLASDVAAVWDSRAYELSPGALGAVARRHAKLARALATTAIAAERLVGLPGRWLLGDAVGMAAPRVIAFGNWALSESSNQARANAHLFDLLLSPRTDLAGALRRTMLRPGDPPGIQAEHALRQARRFALAAWRRRGGRRPVPPWPSSADAAS
jgi:hypothetical protein